MKLSFYLLHIFYLFVLLNNFYHILVYIQYLVHKIINYLCICIFLQLDLCYHNNSNIYFHQHPSMLDMLGSIYSHILINSEHPLSDYCFSDLNKKIYQIFENSLQRHYLLLFSIYIDNQSYLCKSD